MKNKFIICLMLSLLFPTLALAKQYNISKIKMTFSSINWSSNGANDAVVITNSLATPIYVEINVFSQSRSNIKVIPETACGGSEIERGETRVCEVDKGNTLTFYSDSEGFVAEGIFQIDVPNS